MNIKIAVLEDEEEDFRILQNDLTNWATEKGHFLQILRFRNADILKSAFMADCQLLFSDIALGNYAPETAEKSKNGLELCRELRSEGYTGEIVFLTACREFVFEGYDVLAMNYLLKPISCDALVRTMNRYTSLHGGDFFYYHQNNEFLQIPYHDIVSFSQIGHTCFIRTLQQNYQYGASLKSLMPTLPKHFIQCHKSCVVNIDQVISLSGTTLTLASRQTQIVGRKYLNAVRNALIQYADPALH